MKFVKRNNILYIHMFIAILLVLVSPCMASVGEWDYMKQLTINTTNVSDSVSEYPMLIHLNETNFNFTHVTTDGTDIIFATSDNISLSYEVEKWDNVNHDAYIWVNIPLLQSASTTDFIYMYYGNNTDVYRQNPYGVWGNTSYRCVYHMNDPSDTDKHIVNKIDPFNMNGKKSYFGTTSSPVQATGTIGYGQSFNGSSGSCGYLEPVNYLDTTNLTINGHSFSVEQLSNHNILYAVSRGYTGQVGHKVGVAEVDPYSRKSVFTYNDPTWSNDAGWDMGPESVGKYTDGNYLIADTDGGNYIYEMYPNNTKKWSYNTGYNGPLAVPLIINGTDCIALTAYTNLKIIKRSDRTLVWNGTGMFTNTHWVDYRVINNVPKLIVSDWVAHTLNIVDYNTKAIEWSYNTSNVSTVYGPFQVRWLNDTCVVFAEGTLGNRAAVIDTTTNITIYETPVGVGKTVGTSITPDGCILSSASNSGMVINAITKNNISNVSDGNLTGLTLSADIIPNANFTSNSFNTIIGRSGTSSTGNGYSLILKSDGHLAFYVYNLTGARKLLVTSSTLSAGNQYDVDAVLGNDHIMRVYINGSADSVTVGSVDGIAAVTNNLSIGSYYSKNSDGFNGVIDEVRISNAGTSSSMIIADALGITGNLITFGDEYTLTTPVPPTPDTNETNLSDWDNAMNNNDGSVSWILALGMVGMIVLLHFITRLINTISGIRDDGFGYANDMKWLQIDLALLLIIIVAMGTLTYVLDSIHF